MNVKYAWKKLINMRKLLFIGSFWLMLSFFISPGKAAAITGQMTSTIPNNGSAQPWLVVTRPGSNGMDANDQTVSAFVPASSPTFSMTIENACDTSVVDAGATAANDTYFAFFDVTNLTAGANATPGTPAAVAPGTPLWYVQCGSGSNLDITATVGPSAPTVSVNGVNYRQVNIQASITDPTSAFYYVNRFRYTANSGVFLGYAISNNPTIPRDYTGIAYDPGPNNWGWSTKIAFAQECGAGGQSAAVKFWDTDYTSGVAASPYWQDPAHPMQYNLHAYNRASGADQGIVASGNLTGGNNVADQMASITFWADNFYVIEITNINYVNSIQVAVPFSQFKANDLCGGGGGGGARCTIDSVTDQFGGTIQPGERIVFNVTTANAGGMVLGVNGSNFAPQGNYGNYFVGPGEYIRTPIPANGPQLVSLYALNDDSGTSYPNSFTAPGVGTYTFNWGLKTVSPSAWVTSCDGSFTVALLPPPPPPPPPPPVINPVVECTAPGNVTFDQNEVGAPGTLSTSINNKTPAGGPNPVTISTATYTAAPAGMDLSGGPPNTPFSLPTGQGNITQPAKFTAAGDYTLTLVFTYSALLADGTTYNSAPVTCGGVGSAQVIVSFKPYLKSYGADVLSGGSFTPTTGTCPGASAGSGNIYAFAKSAGANYSGASGQFGVLALLDIKEFYSASQRTAFNVPPKGTTFANTDGTKPYGGFFGSSGVCITDYYNKTQDSTIAAGTFSGALAANLGKKQYKNLPVAALSTINTLNVPLGTQAAVYVNGDVFITGTGITFSAGAATRKDMPNFALIVLGNIYISPTVTRLDGLYVAQPSAIPGTGKIYTCAQGLGLLYSAAAIGPGCNTQLSVNGALIAQQVKFYRTRGSLKDAGVREVPAFDTGAGTNAAEVINFTPEMYLAPTALKDPDNVFVGRYDAVYSLPPVY
ncbi:hypothetical protein BH10PAT3_BH10PAT3_7320 [soil metagenome]